MRTRSALLIGCAAVCALAAADSLEQARDKQDRAALENAAKQFAAAAARQPGDAAAQYRLALAQSYVAEVATELRDKSGAKTAAESGIQAAERAVSLQPKVAEYHRILGTLCGQVIPAQVLLALKYGNCARSSIDRAIELDPKSARAYLSRGVGNFYLPAAFGGGVELAVRDFEKAAQLDPKLADVYLWLGIAQRKVQRNEEARRNIAKSIELNPTRVWARQQLEKTPPN